MSDRYGQHLERGCPCDQWPACIPHGAREFGGGEPDICDPHEHTGPVVDWHGVASELAPATLAEWESVVQRHTSALATPPAPTEDPDSPPWEACKECGGQHWTRDHWAHTTERPAPTEDARDALTKLRAKVLEDIRGSESVNRETGRGLDQTYVIAGMTRVLGIIDTAIGAYDLAALATPPAPTEPYTVRVGPEGDTFVASMPPNSPAPTEDDRSNLWRAYEQTSPAPTEDATLASLQRWEVGGGKELAPYLGKHPEGHWVEYEDVVRLIAAQKGASDAPDRK